MIDGSIEGNSIKKLAFSPLAGGLLVCFAMIVSIPLLPSAFAIGGIIAAKRAQFFTNKKCRASAAIK